MPGPPAEHAGDPTPLPLARRIPSRLGLFRSNYFCQEPFHVHHRLGRSRRHCRDRDLGDQRLQRPRRHAAEDQPGLRRHRRAAQAAPRPDPQSGGDGEGLCRPRERNSGGGHPGAQCRGRSARGRAEGGGREHADRRARQVVRAVGELSGPEGQRELPAVAERPVRHREQARRLAPLLQQRGAGIQHRHPAVPGGAVRRHVRLQPASVLRRRRATARNSSRRRA